MRAVLTRVSSASVAIEGKTVGRIGRGYLILLGVGPNDTEETARKHQKSDTDDDPHPTRCGNGEYDRVKQFLHLLRKMHNLY